jgi:hypothetical protein
MSESGLEKGKEKESGSPESPNISGFIYSQKYSNLPSEPPAGESSPVNDEEEGIRILHFTGTEIEEYEEGPISSIAISNPIVLGPLTKIHVPQHYASISFKTAAKRKEIALNFATAERRDLILCIAESVSDRITAPPHRYLAKCAEGAFKTELTMLDELLIALPGKISKDGMVGFYLEPWRYKQIRSALVKIADDRKNILEMFSLKHRHSHAFRTSTQLNLCGRSRPWKFSVRPFART